MKIKKVVYDLKKNKNKLEEIFGKEEADIIINCVKGQQVLYNMEKFIHKKKKIGHRVYFEPELMLYFVNNLIAFRSKERKEVLNKKYCEKINKKGEYNGKRYKTFL